MATVCTPYRNGRRLRATKLDQCGRPLYGQMATVVSAGFVSVEMSTETNDSDTDAQTTASGEVCIPGSSTQTINYHEVTIEFCQVDPDLVSIINPSWTKVVDENGDTIGWEETTDLGQDTGGYALEVWMDAAGGSNDPCDPSSGGQGQGQWGYLLLPHLKGGVPQDLTIENGPITFSYQGRTVETNAWGSGPYPVTIVDGAPSTLFQPMKRNAPRRFQTVTLAPPRAQCGAQRLPRPIPPQAELLLEGIPGQVGDQRMGVRARVNNHGFGPVTIQWGDGTAREEIREGRWVRHDYSDPGTYTLTVQDKQTPSAYTVKRQITIPFPPDNPELTLAKGDDPSGRAVTATWDNHGNGPVTVDFGDPVSGDEAIFTGQPDQGSHTYIYPNPGIYTIEVFDERQPDHISRATVSVPVPQSPAITNSTTSGLQATVTIDNHGNGATTIDWGDGNVTDGPDQGDASHTYTDPGTYTVKVWATGNELASATTEVTVTRPALEASVAADPQDSMTAVLTINNHGAGPTSIVWESGGTPEDGPNQGEATHPYTSGAGTERTITVTDADDNTRTASVTFTPTAPQQTQGTRRSR